MTFARNIDKADCFKGRRQTKSSRYTIHFVKSFQSHCILPKFNIKVVITYFIYILDQNGSEASTSLEPTLVFVFGNRKHFPGLLLTKNSKHYCVVLHKTQGVPGEKVHLVQNEEQEA